MIQGQGGSTLIELLVAMPIAVLLLGLVVQALGNAGQEQQDVERRTEALTSGQLSLERMTREIRQANWVYFQSSSVMDLEVGVRATASASSVPRFVRYDCTTEVCTRSEGAATSYPPPANPSFVSTVRWIGDPASDLGGRNGRIIAHDIFSPTSTDAGTGVAAPDFLDPDFVGVRLTLEVKGRKEPLILEDGVNVRNRSGFES